MSLIVPHEVTAVFRMTLATSSAGVASKSDSDTDMANSPLDCSTGMSCHGVAPPVAPISNNTVEILSDAAYRASLHQSSSNDRHLNTVDVESGKTAPAAAMSTRAYQLEMLHQSLNQNAIVVVRLSATHNGQHLA